MSRRNLYIVKILIIIIEFYYHHMFFEQALSSHVKSIEEWKSLLCHLPYYIDYTRQIELMI